MFDLLLFVVIVAAVAFSCFNVVKTNEPYKCKRFSLSLQWTQAPFSMCIWSNNMKRKKASLVLVNCDTCRCSSYFLKFQIYNNNNVFVFAGKLRSLSPFKYSTASRLGEMLAGSKWLSASYLNGKSVSEIKNITSTANQTTVEQHHETHDTNNQCAHQIHSIHTNVGWQCSRFRPANVC